MWKTNWRVTANGQKQCICCNKDFSSSFFRRHICNQQTDVHVPVDVSEIDIDIPVVSDFSSLPTLSLDSNYFDKFVFGNL